MSRVMGSTYMEWAKLRSGAKYALATSGIANRSLEVLGATLEDLEINGPSTYGYPPLQAAMATHLEVPAECVVAAAGTSMANHLAMAALFEPGDDVLFEQPTYEPMLATALYLGARVRRVSRRAGEGFRLAPEDVAAAVRPETRLIVLANLHNPSSHFTDVDALRAIGAAAESVGARVLVDEVYLDAIFEPRQRSAFHLGPAFVTTSSLTKIYGLSGLRCGWVLAEPELAHRMWRLNDVFGSVPAHPAERLAVIAFDRLDELLARSRDLLDINRHVLNSFLDTRDDLSCPRLAFGTTACARWLGGDVTTLCRLLRERYETSVVPGHFFELPDHVRIGLGGDTDTLMEGLRRLGSALDDLRTA